MCAAGPEGGWAIPLTARSIACVALAVICVGFCLSIHLLIREREVAASERRLVSKAQLLARSGQLTPDFTAINLSQPVRSLLHDAQLRMMQVPFAANANERQSLIANAERAVNAALLLRPGWGETQVANAYIQSLKGTDSAVSARSALALSYRQAPYLRGAAEWRTRYGFASWTALPQQTRDQIVNEAIWFMRLRPAYRESLLAAARGTPAYVPLMLRWRTVRALDDDLAPN